MFYTLYILPSIITLALLLLLLYYKVHLALICVVCYFVFFICVIWSYTKDRHLYHKYPHQSSSRIPKCIYTYWHTTDMPKTVERCIQSWRRHAPDYTIHILHKNNLSEYNIDMTKWKHATTPQRLSDFIRLTLLSDHGGIWMDASTYLNASLDWVHGYQYHTQCECVGFELPSKTPNVESWFLAATPQSRFINDWKNALNTLNDYPTIANYITHVEKTTDVSSIRNKEYLTVYVALQTILQKQIPHSYSLQLLNATGPCVNHLVMGFPFLLIDKEPVLKMIKVTRSFMELSRMYHLL